MKIRFGTFNLFQFVEPPYSWYIKKDKFNNEQWENKCKWIKEQLQKMDCDIIGFQEVFSTDALKKLTFELGYTYFETIDSARTKKENDKVYTSTIVAIASKYPIKSLEKVKVKIKTLNEHNFEGYFRFSRIPIKAKIELPNNLEIYVYVTHLKSNRLNEFEYIFNKDDKLEDKKKLIKKALDNKYSPSMQQRLCEASSLFFDIKKSINTPTLFMCDLNDKEFSITIDALTNCSYHDDTKKSNYILNDAYYLYENKIHNPHPEQKEQKRKATSYYQSKGNVLDYIFVSNHFNKKNKNNLATISKYDIFDEHLQKNQNGSLLQSDHSQVVCEIQFK